jgi:hypothetical protein
MKNNEANDSHHQKLLAVYDLPGIPSKHTECLKL